VKVKKIGGMINVAIIVEVITAFAILSTSKLNSFAKIILATAGGIMDSSKTTMKGNPLILSNSRSGTVKRGEHIILINATLNPFQLSFSMPDASAPSVSNASLGATLPRSEITFIIEGEGSKLNEDEIKPTIRAYIGGNFKSLLNPSTKFDETSKGIIKLTMIIWPKMKNPISETASAPQREYASGIGRKPALM